MTFADFDQLNMKYRCILYALLAEKASAYITDLRAHLLLKNAITYSWEWIETGRYCGNDFFDVVIEEMQLTGLLFYLGRAQKSNDKSAGAWGCIVDAIMYIARKAYEKDGYTSAAFPEAIGQVKDYFIQLAIESLLKTADVQEYIEEVYDLCLKETAIADIQRRFGLYQMKIDFAKLNDKYKCAFLLILVEKGLSCIEKETQRDYAKRALDACWEWLDTGKHSGATLIEFAGDEDNGLYNYEITEKEPIVTTALNMVVTVVSFAARMAFEREGVRDIPKFAAVTTDAVVPYVLDRFTMCYKNTDSRVSNAYKLALIDYGEYIGLKDDITEVEKNKIAQALEFVMDTADVEAYINEFYALCLNETDIASIKQRLTL